jgi:hypothetical protein
MGSSLRISTVVNRPLHPTCREVHPITPSTNLPILYETIRYTLLNHSTATARNPDSVRPQNRRTSTPVSHRTQRRHHQRMQRPPAQLLTAQMSEPMKIDTDVLSREPPFRNGDVHGESGASGHSPLRLDMPRIKGGWKDTYTGRLTIVLDSQWRREGGDEEASR